MQETGKDYYSSREAAQLLGIAVSTVQLWTDNGLLSAWKTVGGHRRIARSSVDDILNKKQAIASKKNRQISVVVVEDDKKQLMMYEKLIKAWIPDANVVTASNGYEGLFKIGLTSADIIITDLMMPQMDGFEMIKNLKKQPELSDSLIIVISAMTADEIKFHGGLPQGLHIFSKPVMFDDLQELFIKKCDSLAA